VPFVFLDSGEICPVQNEWAMLHLYNMTG